MSDFLAEAQVLIRPDLTGFRAQLIAQLAAIKVPPVTVQIVPGKLGTGALASQLTGFARLDEVQKQVKDNLLREAGANAAAELARKKATQSLLGAATATSRLNAGLLALRTAAGGNATIGLGALAVAAIVTGEAIRGMVRITAQFEQELNTFQAVAGATADEMERVSAAALALGADVRLPAVSAADAAVALTELARAGLSVQDALDGAEGVLQLATAAQITHAEAARIAANALNAFGLAGDQATRVADVLANAANAAQGSISDFALAFQQSTAVARQVGLSLEDTSALLTLFAKSGLRGSDAGTSLRVSLIKLIAPTEKAKAIIDKLGITIRDAQGNVRPDVFAQFAEATSELSPAMRDANAAVVFGTDGLRALAIAGRAGAEGLRLAQFEADQQGTAAEVAAARTKGLAGEAAGLSSNMQTLGINIGQVTNPVLTGFVKSLSATVGGVNKLAGAIGDVGSKVEDQAGKDSGFGKFVEDLSKSVGDFAEDKGLFRLRDAVRGATSGIGEGSLSAAQKLRLLNKELQSLQTARIEVQKGGLSDLADQFTGDIDRIQERIAALGGETAAIGPKIAAPLRAALEVLQQARSAQTVLGKDTTRLDAAIIKIAVSIGDYERAARLGITATNSVASGFERMDRNARDATFSVSALTVQMANLTHQSDVLGDALLKIESEGGTPAQRIAVLQQRVETNRGIISEAELQGRQSGDITAIRKARRQIIADQNEIDSLQKGVVSDTKAAAASAQADADEAQKNRDEQFQALAELFGGRQDKIEGALTTAGITGNLDAQVRLNIALIRSLTKERRTLLDRLKTLKVSADVRKQILDAITAAIKKAKDDNLRFQQEIEKNAQEAVETKQANILEGIQLNIDLFSTTGNVSREIAARRRLIKELKNAQNKVDEGTLEYKRLRNAIAAENAAIAELQGEKEEQQNALGQLGFAFLQKIEGFSANLLGNLIPGFATGGLVSGAQAPPENLVTPTQSIQAQASGGRVQGPTFGQAATEVDILKDMLRVLKDIKSGRTHPEAHHQRQVQSSVGDMTSGGGQSVS